MGILGDLGGEVVAVLFLERRDQHQRVLEAALDIVEPRLDADDTVLGEGDRGIGEQADGLQEIVGHHRVEDVELEMALAASEGDGGIVAEDVRADLGQRFALSRVHLAGHDRRAGLVLGQRQLAKSGTWTRAEEADVVGNLEAAHGDRRDGAVGEDHRVMRGEGLELVRGGREFEAGDLADLGRNALGKTRRRGEAGADGGAALRQLHQHRQGHLDPLDAVLDLLGIAGEFLAQRHGGRILRMGAADLDDALPGLGLVVQRIVQDLQRREQPVDHLLRTRNVHGGRERVVRGLAHVDMVVRVDRLLRTHLAAQHLDGAVGDHLVGIHVGLGA